MENTRNKIDIMNISYNWCQLLHMNSSWKMQCYYYSTSNLQGKQFILKKMNIYNIRFVNLFPVCKKNELLWNLKYPWAN